MAQITQSKGIDLGIETSAHDFMPRVKSWDKLPYITLDIEDESGDWRFIRLRPIQARALAKGLNKMAKLCEVLDA